MDKNIFSAVDQYIEALFIAEDEALQHTAKSITDAGMPQHSVSPNQGKFLYMLALISQAKNILEIGTLGGYSTIWLARALPEKGKLITLENDPKHAAIAEQNMEKAGILSRVEIRTGNALDLLPVLETEQKGPFDMIFIDADKMSYPHYLEWAVRLSRPGTLIVADNVIRAGKILEADTIDESAIGARQFNELLAMHPYITATIVQNVGTKGHDGMALGIVNATQ